MKQDGKNNIKYCYYKGGGATWRTLAYPLAYRSCNGVCIQVKQEYEIEY